jgi:hypothetical protein
MRRAQNEFELKIKKIRNDNETEFKNIGVDQYLTKEGIKHEFLFLTLHKKWCHGKKEPNSY